MPGELKLVHPLNANKADVPEIIRGWSGAEIIISEVNPAN